MIDRIDQLVKELLGYLTEINAGRTTLKINAGGKLRAFVFICREDPASNSEILAAIEAVEAKWQAQDFNEGDRPESNDV